MVDAIVGYVAIGHDPLNRAKQLDDAFEAVQIVFNPQQLTYENLLAFFWSIHDAVLDSSIRPGAVKRYCSAIMPHSEDQRMAAFISRDQEAARVHKPLTTKIPDSWAFSPADGDDQRFCERHDYRYGIEAVARPRHPWRDYDIPVRPGLPSPLELTRSMPALPLRLARNLDQLHHRLLGNDDHFIWVISALQSWLPGTLWEPGTGRSVLRDLAVVHRALPLQTELWTAIDGAELDLIAALSPGNYLPSLRTERIYVACGVHEHDKDSGIDVIGPTRPGRYPRGQHAATTDTRPSPALSPGCGSRTWFDYVADAELELDCGDGVSHTIRWRRGQLLLDAHPTDTYQSELSLQALGGDTCPCLAVLQAWETRWASRAWWDTDRFDSWTIGAHTVGAPQRETASAMTLYGHVAPQDIKPLPATHGSEVWPISRRETVREQRQQVAQQVLQLLYHLPAAFRFRWALTAIIDLAAHRSMLSRGDRAMLQAAFFDPLRETVLDTLWQWCRFDPTITYGQLELVFIDDGDSPTVRGTVVGDTAHITVAQPFRWLIDVWLRGVAHIDGYFVVEIEPMSSSDRTIDCLVARWEQTPAAGLAVVVCPAIAHWVETHWELRLA